MEKARIMNANVEDKAREYIHVMHISYFDTLGKLNSLLQKAFSDRIVWNNFLMSSRQKSEESIKEFVIRLKLVARKFARRNTEQYLFKLHLMKQSIMQFTLNDRCCKK